MDLMMRPYGDTFARLGGRFFVHFYDESFSQYTHSNFEMKPFTKVPGELTRTIDSVI